VRRRGGIDCDKTRRHVKIVPGAVGMQKLSGHTNLGLHNRLVQDGSPHQEQRSELQARCEFPGPLIRAPVNPRNAPPPTSGTSHYGRLRDVSPKDLKAQKAAVPSLIEARESADRAAASHQGRRP
jgi:hypothetical protein